MYLHVFTKWGCRSYPFEKEISHKVSEATPKTVLVKHIRRDLHYLNSFGNQKSKSPSLCPSDFGDLGAYTWALRHWYSVGLKDSVFCFKNTRTLYLQSSFLYWRIHSPRPWEYKPNCSKPGLRAAVGHLWPVRSALLLCLHTSEKINDWHHCTGTQGAAASYVQHSWQATSGVSKCTNGQTVFLDY